MSATSSWSRKYFHTYKTEPFPRAAILIIIMLMLVRVCDPTITTSIRYDGVVNIVVPVIMILLYLFLPVIALYSHLKCAKYRIVLISLFICLFITIYFVLIKALQITRVISDGEGIWTDIGNSIGTVFILAQHCITILLLTYGGELLADGSSDQLSSFIWWFYWCLYFGWTVTTLLSCGLHAKTTPSGALYIVSGHALSLILIIIILISNWSRLLPETRQRVVNPLFLIGKVFNFARRTPNPIHRSSFSSWDPAKVSRLDLAKHSLGGPFTTEEVESVKVFLNLLPLLVCVQLLYLLMPASLGRLNYHEKPFGKCLISSSHFVHYCLALVLIPLKQFGLKYVKFLTLSLLQKIGSGLFLVLMSRILLIGVGVYVAVSDGNYTCELMTDMPYNETVTGFVSDHTLLIIPHIIAGLGAVLVIPSSLEFFFAQSPYHMRTLIIGIFIGLGNIFETLSWQLLRIFKLPFMEKVHFGCEFYVFLSGFLVLCLSFSLFLCQAKRYKLRVRDYSTSDSSWFSYGSNWGLND